MSLRQRRRLKYIVLGIVGLLVLYLTVVRPPFRSAAARWGVRGAMLAFLVYGALVEPRWLRISRHEVAVEGLPLALDGLRIAHATDFHIGTPGLTRGDFRRVVQRVEEFQPDLIALTGDFVARSGWSLAQFRDCLPLSARHGCFAVLGNSDRGHADAIGAELEALGVRVLNNQSELVRIEDATIAVIGVDDPSAKRDDLEAAMRGVPAEVGLTLLLAHAPNIADRMGQHEVNLILVGHTHGGQVRLPLLHLLVRKGVSRYRNGWFQIGKVKMFVNRGIGHVMPFRFLCPPEVALITLKHG